jgi:dephospho-CoA kinase
LRTLVIGVAGTGKSFIVKEMRRRGFNAVDADEALATFVDEEGKEVDYDPKGGASWWASHFYVLKRRELESLLRRNDPVYLFGNVGGQPGRKNGLSDIAHLFDRVCYLKAPEAVIKRRLASRGDNPFGKNPEELELTMMHEARLAREAKKRKFEIVDATLPIDDIIKIVAGKG